MRLFQTLLVSMALCGCKAAGVPKQRLFSLQNRSGGQPSPATILLLPPQARVAWEASPDSSVICYNVYYGGQSRAYTNAIAVSGSQEATVSGLVMGATYYFAVTALDALGDESEFSNEAVFTVPQAIRLSFPEGFTNLQMSADLVNWTDCNASQDSNGVWRVSVDMTIPQAFYRARQ
jgi:hypothetical protein